MERDANAPPPNSACPSGSPCRIATAPGAIPSARATISGNTVSWPWPEECVTLWTSTPPSSGKVIATSSFGVTPPEGSTNSAQPMPRSLPVASDSARRAGKPAQSASTAARSSMAA